MTRYEPRRRVDVVLDAGREDPLLRILDAAGAEGYTLLHGVTGKGDGVHGDDPFGIFENVWCTVLADPATAERIVERVMELPGTKVAFVGDVQVAVPDESA